MLFEIAQPISLLLCLLSLYSVFHRAFLVPGSDLEQRLMGSLSLLALSACLCVVSGFIFCEAHTASEESREKLFSTLPVQLFCWAAFLFIALFCLSWYLEAYCIFYRDVRRI